MALLFADGFEDGDGRVGLGTSMTVGTGRYGSGLVAGATTGYASTGFTPAATIIVGFAFKPATSGQFFVLGNAGSTQVGFTRLSGGGVDVWRSSSGTVLGSTAANVLPVGVWSYFEVRTLLADAGNVILRVNGVEVLNLPSVDTKPIGDTVYNTLMLGVSGGAVAGNVWDDFYVCDTTGSYNNDFLGDLTVEHLRPASDDTAQWLGSDANSVNNWDLVDEAGAPGTADYVMSSTVGQRELYVPAPSARPSGASVKGVVVTAVAQKTDVGARTAKLLVKEGSGGTVRQSAELGLPTSFGELRAVFDRKADGSAFTVADVNALRMGIEVTA